MPKDTRNQPEETVRIRDLTLVNRWTGIHVESKIIQDQEENPTHDNREGWSLKSYLVDGNTDQPLMLDGISFPTDNDISSARESKSFDTLPVKLFRCSKSASQSGADKYNSLVGDQVDHDILPIDELISVVPKYLSLTQKSASQIGSQTLSLTYDNHLSLSGEKSVRDENEFLKLTYTEAALLKYTKELSNDPWNLKTVQDETFNTQKIEFDQLMNSQEDRGLKGMMKNWKRGVKMNYELRCHRSTLKSHKEFVSLLPTGTDREERHKMEKSERMIREKSRQIRGLEDKVINTRKRVERDLKKVGKGRDTEWSWPEDIDDWRDILDRLTREKITKQEDPVFTSASEGVNDTVIDKGGKPTMVHEISKSTTTELPASLHTAHDNGHDTNETDSSSIKASVPLGTVNIARASPKDHMTGWDTAKGGWKKPWEDKKDATSKSKSEILADNLDDEGFTTVSNRKRKQKKDRASLTSEQRQGPRTKPTASSKGLSYRIRSYKSTGSGKSQIAGIGTNEPTNARAVSYPKLRGYSEMVESDENPRDLDDPVESDIGQFDDDNTSSNHAGTSTPSVISEILEPESYYPIVNGQRHVPLGAYESSTSNSSPLNPKAAAFEPRE